MILYFTGTGNSRYAAQIIEKVTGDKLVSINEFLKNNMKGNLRSEKLFVFVVPTYAWKIPRIVEDFIREVEFSGTNKVYFVMTCGVDAGDSINHIKKLCDEKNFNLKGYAEIKMPENYIAMFDVPKKEECDKVLEKADEVLFYIADKIKNNEKFEEKSVTILDKLKSGIVNSLFYTFCVSSKGFYAEDKCIGCGKCVTLCPLNNIQLRNKKPKWGSDCTHCMACICACPVEAIEYKNKTKDKHRYYNKGY